MHVWVNLVDLGSLDRPPAMNDRNIPFFLFCQISAWVLFLNRFLCWKTSTRACASPGGRRRGCCFEPCLKGAFIQSFWRHSRLCFDPLDPLYQGGGAPEGYRIPIKEQQSKQNYRGFSPFTLHNFKQSVDTIPKSNLGGTKSLQTIFCRKWSEHFGLFKLANVS